MPKGLIPRLLQKNGGGFTFQRCGGGHVNDSRLQVPVGFVGCTEKMTLMNSNELQRHRNGVLERGLSWCGSGGSMSERLRGCC